MQLYRHFQPWTVWISQNNLQASFTLKRSVNTVKNKSECLLGKTVIVVKETEPVILPWTQNMSADSHRLVSTQEVASRKLLHLSRRVGITPRFESQQTDSVYLARWINTTSVCPQTMTECTETQNFLGCRWEKNMCSSIKHKWPSEINYVTTPCEGRQNSKGSSKCGLLPFFGGCMAAITCSLKKEI